MVKICNVQAIRNLKTIFACHWPVKLEVIFILSSIDKWNVQEFIFSNRWFYSFELHKEQKKSISWLLSMLDVSQKCCFNYNISISKHLYFQFTQDVSQMKCLRLHQFIDSISFLTWKSLPHTVKLNKVALNYQSYNIVYI